MSGSVGKEGATSSPTTENSEKICVEAILYRHAKKLLSAYRMYDMAYFAANLDDYQFVAWLRKERYVCFVFIFVVGVVRAQLSRFPLVQCNTLLFQDQCMVKREVIFLYIMSWHLTICNCVN